ncbi:MAG: LysR substrate-binding domain-containing protein [Hyphomonadaceae bacterium]
MNCFHPWWGRRYRGRVDTPLPSLQSLRVLDAAARLGSYARAAEELGLTHGAVSHQIRALEAWVNAPLFEKAGRQMTPTSTALGLLARTRTAIGILGEAFGHPVVRRQTQGLVVATTPGIARFWLLPRLRELPEGLIASIRTSSSLDAPAEEPADAYLRYGPGGWPALQSECLSAETVAPVAHPRFKKDGELEPEAIMSLPLLASPFQTWLTWFEAAGLGARQTPAPILELSDMGLVIDAAALGLGVALAPRKLVEPHVRRGELVRLADLEAPEVYGYHLAWPPTTKKSDAIAHLRTWLRAEFAADAPSQPCG